MTVLEARVVLDVEAFAEEVVRCLKPQLANTPELYAPDQILEAVKKVFAEFQDEKLEKDEGLCLEEWLSGEEEEEEDEEEDTWDDDVDGEED